MKNSIVSRNHYANYPLSANAMLSIMTSAYDHPGKELIIQNYPTVPLLTMSEILKDRGYRTCLIHTGSLKYADQRTFLKKRKFDRILEYKTLKHIPPYNYMVGWGLDERALIAPTVKFIKEERGKPFFITLMPVNPHHPYAIPEKTEADRQRFMITGEIAENLPRKTRNRLHYINSLHYADAALGELIATLEKQGLMENTLLFLFADHGEAFYEHRKNYNHPFFLYEENVHVPFLIYNSTLISSTVELKGMTRHIDILPTVLDLLGVRGTREQEGISMLTKHPQQMAMLHTNWKDDYFGIRDGHWKYIRRVSDSFEELYDLDQDPEEKNSICSLYPDVLERYRACTDNALQYTTAYYNVILKGVERGKNAYVFNARETTFEEFMEHKKKKKPDNAVKDIPGSSETIAQ